MIRKSKKAKARWSIVKQLDSAAREAVFARDSNHCVRCPNNRTIQWAHIFGRRHKCIRWDTDNALTLCAGCHRWWHEYPALSGDWFKKNWPDRYERILRKFNAGGKVTVVDMREMLEELTAMPILPVGAKLPLSADLGTEPF